MAKPLHSTVIQIYMANLKPTVDTLGIDGIAMILCCDVNPACLEVADGMIGATMTKFQFERSATKRSSYELMS